MDDDEVAEVPKSKFDFKTDSKAEVKSPFGKTDSVSTDKPTLSFNIPETKTTTAPLFSIPSADTKSPFESKSPFGAPSEAKSPFGAASEAKTDLFGKAAEAKSDLFAKPLEFKATEAKTDATKTVVPDFSSAFAKSDTAKSPFEAKSSESKEDKPINFFGKTDDKPFGFATATNVQAGFNFGSTALPTSTSFAPAKSDSESTEEKEIVPPKKRKDLDKVHI